MTKYVDPNRSRLVIVVFDDETGHMHRVTGEEAMLLETLWGDVPEGCTVTRAGVGALRNRLGWSVKRFDRVRYSLHTSKPERWDLLHEPHRDEYEYQGQTRVDRQSFILQPLTRKPVAQAAKRSEQ